MRLSARFVFILVLAVGIAACSSADETSDGPTNPADDQGRGASSDVDVDGEPDWEGAPLNPFDLRAGACFNEVSWTDREQNRRINITAAVDCSRPHDKEVYHEAEFPAPNGAPFPGEDALSAWSTEVCYEAFEDFVGAEYELSVYDIDFLQPTQETFEHPVGRHRRVTCFLFNTEEDKSFGTARGARA
ncbi:MAG: septum formation family protein [Acidimicrobiales bacterium]